MRPWDLRRHIFGNPACYPVPRTAVISAVVYFREGDGNPLQYSCLENPMYGGAW